MAERRRYRPQDRPRPYRKEGLSFQEVMRAARDRGEQQVVAIMKLRWADNPDLPHLRSAMAAVFREIHSEFQGVQSNLVQRGAHHTDRDYSPYIEGLAIIRVLFTKALSLKTLGVKKRNPEPEVVRRRLKPYDAWDTALGEGDYYPASNHAKALASLLHSRSHEPLPEADVHQFHAFLGDYALSLPNPPSKIKVAHVWRALYDAIVLNRHPLQSDPTQQPHWITIQKLIQPVRDDAVRAATKLLGQS